MVPEACDVLMGAHGNVDLNGSSTVSEVLQEENEESVSVNQDDGVDVSNAQQDRWLTFYNIQRLNLEPQAVMLQSKPCVIVKLEWLRLKCYFVSATHISELEICPSDQCERWDAYSGGDLLMFSSLSRSD